MDKIADRNIFIKDGTIIPHGQAKLMATMLKYKIFIDKNDDDLSLLTDLREAALINEFKQDEHFVTLSLTTVENLTPVLSRFLSAGKEIRGITPLTADIENLYSAIYENGV